jgi:phage/plasmid-associated DNA primase
MSISAKLEDGPFKDQVVREMREYMLDLQFVDKLDSLPNLIAFDNGVWDLDAGGFRESTPDDLICKSVGYSYTEHDAPAAEAVVREYWDVMHPDVDQRAYVLRTFARQLYGDRGHELFHVHSGHLASASNGKTGFFEAFQAAAGEYVCKFGVEVLTTKQRAEPTHDDVLHSGILKDLTGGEQIVYRLLFSNAISCYRPMHKLHMMCNDKPKLNGGDSGVASRRVAFAWSSTTASLSSPPRWTLRRTGTPSTPRRWR